jgi:hypothetical protein
MNLTLGVVAGILLILPGLAAMAAWNIRANRSGATRPDLPLTAVSVLLIAIGASLAAHLLSYMLVEAVRVALVAAGTGLPQTSSMTLPLQVLLTDGHELRPVWSNPFVAALHAATAKDAELAPFDAVWLAIAIIFESLIVFSVVSDEGFELGVEDIDVSNQGWVFQHYVRPAQNGYRAIAHVLTSTTHNGLGVAYRGTVVDLRQSEKGETLAISLLEPERFLYELTPAKPDAWHSPARAAAFKRSEAEYVGGVVSLEARVIANVVIQTVQAGMIDEIYEEAKASDDADKVFADV